MSEQGSGPRVLDSSGQDPAAHASARQALLDVRHEVAKAVVGQDATVTGLLIALLSQGMCCWRAYRAWPRPCWSVHCPRR